TKTHSSDLTPVEKTEIFKAFRDRWMARKNGILTQINELWLKGAPNESKRDAGQAVNSIRTKVMGLFGDAEKAFHLTAFNQIAISINDKLVMSDAVSVNLALDITLPGTCRPIGAEHLIIKTMNEIVGVFRNLGYSVEEGPEIETDYYNFEALN